MCATVFGASLGYVSNLERALLGLERPRTGPAAGGDGLAASLCANAGAVATSVTTSDQHTKSNQTHGVSFGFELRKSSAVLNSAIISVPTLTTPIRGQSAASAHAAHRG